MSIDISNASTEDLKGFFDYGFITHKDLEEELKKRKFILDIHGEIMSLDDIHKEVKKEMLLFADGEIGLKDFQERIGDLPADIFFPIYNAVLLELAEEISEAEPIKKKRWEILDFS